MCSTEPDHSTDGIIPYHPNNESDYCGGQLEYYERFGYPPGYEWMKQSLREDNVGDKDESTTDEKSSGHDDIRRLSSSSQSVQHFGLASSRQRQRPRLSVRSVHNSIRSVHRHAKLIRRGSSMKSEGGEAYRDEVLARIFRYQRDKRIERQIALIQSALKDIRKDMQSLRESIAHGHLD